MRNPEDDTILPYRPLLFDDHGNIVQGDSLSDPEGTPPLSEEEINARIKAMEEEGLAKGLEKGRTSGYEKGLKDGEKEVLKKLERLEGILKELEAFRKKKMNEVLPSIIELSLDIAKKVLHKEIELDRSVVLEIAREAVSKVGEGESRIVLKVNPMDYEVIAGSSEALRDLSGAKEIVIESFSAVAPGGCIIETKTGEIDATIESQVKEVEDVIGTATNS